jgi:hypothetical protein
VFSAPPYTNNLGKRKKSGKCTKHGKIGADEKQIIIYFTRQINNKTLYFYEWC